MMTSVSIHVTDERGKLLVSGATHTKVIEKLIDMINRQRRIIECIYDATQDIADVSAVAHEHKAVFRNGWNSASEHIKSKTRGWL